MFNKQVDAQINDIKQLKRDLSDKSCQLLDSQATVHNLTLEIEQLKSTLTDADFHFTKFKRTSQVVKNLINKPLSLKITTRKGWDTRQLLLHTIITILVFQ